jgi:hypothetical protein
MILTAQKTLIHLNIQMETMYKIEYILRIDLLNRERGLQQVKMGKFGGERDSTCSDANCDRVLIKCIP